MNIKNWIRYLFEPMRKDLCAISYIYSQLVDLDKYGKLQKRSWKEHRNKYMETIQSE